MIIFFVSNKSIFIKRIILELDKCHNPVCQTRVRISDAKEYDLIYLIIVSLSLSLYKYEIPSLLLITGAFVTYMCVVLWKKRLVFSR